MGDMIKDSTTHDVLHQIGRRMGPDEATHEMAAVHKEFGIFSGKYSLTQAYRALHIVPADHQERRKWFRYLDTLNDYPSDVDGMNGHDRILKAYRENLEADRPLPSCWKTHLMKDDPRVTVSTGNAVVHEDQIGRAHV